MPSFLGVLFKLIMSELVNSNSARWQLYQINLFVNTQIIVMIVNYVSVDLLEV